MSNTKFKTTDIPHEELAAMWENECERRVKAEDRIRMLEAVEKQLRGDISRLERLLSQMRAKRNALFNTPTK